MMKKALREAEESDGVGVWFPSPSEYEPTAFLAALSDVVAARYQAYYDSRNRRLTRASLRRNVLYTYGGLTLAYAALVLLVTGAGDSLTRTGLPHWFNTLNALFLLVGVIGLFLLGSGVRGFLRDRSGLGRIRRKAEDLRRQVRYTVNATENTELGMDGKFSGIGARLKHVHERQLVERPATLSSLIHNFRAFVEEMAKTVKGPVVITIDELDKMSDASRVAQLFRDIKGIFEIPGAYFLVSLSDEAARALGLGAVRARNEFNSSFYTVISLPSLPPAECLTLLKGRDPEFDEVCGLAIGVLAGGIPREVVRVAELVRSRRETRGSLQETVEVVVGEELDAFAAQVLAACPESQEEPVGDADRLFFFEELDQIRGALEDERDAFAEALRAAWKLNADHPGWEKRFGEEWRRVLVRLAVAWLLVARPGLLKEENALLELQQILIIAASASAVGRLRLEEFLVTRQPSIPAGSEG